jgi:hypothetical protein
MPVRKMLLLFFLFSSCSCFAQEEPEELLKWSETRKLTWDDYKATPDSASEFAASTTTYLEIEYTFMTDGFRFKIKSSFSKANSWGFKKTNYILRHEQGHFDIAEIFARKLYQQMKQYKFNSKSCKEDTQKIYNTIVDEKAKMQDDYDRETNHSINKEKQKEWLKAIGKMLEDYKDFSGY